MIRNKIHPIYMTYMCIPCTCDSWSCTHKMTKGTLTSFQLAKTRHSSLSAPSIETHRSIDAHLPNSHPPIPSCPTRMSNVKCKIWPKRSPCKKYESINWPRTKTHNIERLLNKTVFTHWRCRKSIDWSWNWLDWRKVADQQPAPTVHPRKKHGRDPPSSHHR